MEQPTGDTQNNDCVNKKKEEIDYLTTNNFTKQNEYYTRTFNDKVLSIYIYDTGEVKFWVSMDYEVTNDNIPKGFYEDSFATYSRVDDTPRYKNLGSSFGKKYTYQYESEQTPNRKYCNTEWYSKEKSFNDSTLKSTIDTLINKLS